MKPLIYPKFIGRLGNNLFQIAACIGYAKKHGVGWGIRKGYVESGFNAFQVDKFFPHLPGIPRDEGYGFKVYNEPYFNYQEIPFVPRGVTIVGFWQSVKYFEHCQQEVKDALRIQHKEGYEGYCSIHVRRGDYLKHPDNFPTVTLDYLRKAMYEVASRGTTKFMVFSDDLQWCKENINGDYDIRFSNEQNEYNDLCAMASCKDNIIANSSFSWWGAFLNRNPDKVVVSPHYQNWFGPNAGPVKDQTQDLIPDGWIQIKFR
jgi:hypothetical protein